MKISIPMISLVGFTLGLIGGGFAFGVGVASGHNAPITASMACFMAAMYNLIFAKVVK